MINLKHTTTSAAERHGATNCAEPGNWFSIVDEAKGQPLAETDKSTLASLDKQMPLMESSHPLLVRHLLEVYAPFATADLQRVLNLALDRPDLWIQGSYQSFFVEGGGCLLHHLSQGLIKCRETLALFYTGRPWFEVTDLECYAAPKWIVRIFDGEAVELYDGCNNLPLELIVESLEFTIAARKETTL